MLAAVINAVVQVFRTYNASITLDRLLAEMEEGGGIGHEGQPYHSRTMEAKKADYDRANKEVSSTASCWGNALWWLWAFRIFGHCMQPFVPPWRGVSSTEKRLRAMPPC